MDTEQVELTIQIPADQARALEASDVPALALHADGVVLTQLLKWNIIERANRVLELAEGNDESPAGIANFADQIQRLSFAHYKIDAGAS